MHCINDTFFVNSTSGEIYKIKLDPLEELPGIVCDEIQSQLPLAYKNNNFKVMCDGKDLRYFDNIAGGIGDYFSTLGSRIYVVGSSGCPQAESSATASSAEKVKLKLLYRLKKFEEKGFTLSRDFTMDSKLNEITHELALLHVLKDRQMAESDNLSVRKCIAHGCGNFLAPDEDLRCKICDY